MNIQEALIAAINGCKVRNKHAAKGYYMMYNLKEQEFQGYYPADKQMKTEDFSGSYEEPEWELYEEPKPKKEKWILWQKDCGKKKPKEGTYKDGQIWMETGWEGAIAPSSYWCMSIYRYKKVSK